LQAIQPIPIEPPEIAAPPEELACQTALKSFHNFPGKIVEKFPVIL